MDVKPIGKRVLIEPNKTEEKTKGGIYIPDSAGEMQHKGKVIAVGDDKDMPVEKGDIVLYEPMGSDEISVDGEKMILIKFDSILAKVR